MIDFRRLSLLISACTFAVSINACSRPSNSERCADIEEYLEGREGVLYRDCEVDTDCQVVWVRPDAPIGAVLPPDDVELRRAIETYRSDCAPLPQASGTLRAVCEPQIIDEELPDGSTVEIITGGLCIVRGDVIVPDVGVVDEPDVEEDTGVCGCTTDSECGGGEQCFDCLCYPTGLCYDACVNAAGCGGLDGLNLGTSVDVCAAQCETAIANEGDFQAFAQCLRDASCADYEACASLVP